MNLPFSKIQALNKKMIGIGAVAILVLAGFGISRTSIGTRSIGRIQDYIEEKTMAPAAPSESLSVEAELPKSVAIDVPFTAQAPIGNWEDERFQNACEEASILMAMGWVRKDGLTESSSLDAITKIVAYQQEKYGFHQDTSAKDTAKLIQDYFQYQNIEYRENVTVQDIQKELAKGNIIVAPVNGQKLNNKYFIPPGPIEHMLVVVGYNQETNEFITNDPGTKRGKNYPYKTHVFYRAMQDYPSGFHLPITEIKKNMIVIKPST